MLRGGGGGPSFRRAMVFIDGTNLFYRLRDARLRLRPAALQSMAGQVSVGRELMRIYLYTSQPHLDAARKTHTQGFDSGVRISLGHAIPTGDGNHREKGVDALLIADLVYHAAARNYDFAILLSADADFVTGLNRVEDFGCRTHLVSVCVEAPPLLSSAADGTTFIDVHQLIANEWAEQIE